GAPRGLIAEALIERAELHELVDELGGREAVETIVAEGLGEPVPELLLEEQPPPAWQPDPEPAYTPPPLPKLVRVNIARYDTEPIPEREWGVRDRFPRHNVALMSGEGAIGKSILF